MSVKCNFCERDATRKDYRCFDGQTSKYVVCDECSGTSDVGILKIEAQCEKVFKEIYLDNLDNEVEDITSTAWGDFWNSVNELVFRLDESNGIDFEEKCGMEPHSNTIEKWRDDFFELVSQALRKECQ